MKEFMNPGCGRCILLQQHNKTFIAAIVETKEFVVASCLSEDGSWIYGNYFTDIRDAAEFFHKEIA